MIVVTSGKRYIDIDAYAGCIAYAKLLNLKGKEAKAVSKAQINESITPSIIEFNTKLDQYEPNEDDNFIIIDVSNRDFFDEMVNENKIIEIIDHHTGYEKYWKEKLKENSKIEFIGSVATIIVELYEKENLMQEIDKELAILLMAAILDNTLNLKAKITTQRDILAYQKLEKIANEKNYSEKYFKECQLKIEQDLKAAIENDTKIENINYLLPSVFGQLVIWDKESIIRNREIIYNVLNSVGDKWMMNLICLKEGKSYIIAKDIEVQRNLEKLFNKKFKTDLMELDDAWLRKEIMKKAREYNKK